MLVGMWIQLPVARPVAADLINSGALRSWPGSRRFPPGGQRPIITRAHAINAGTPPIYGRRRLRHTTFYFLPATRPRQAVALILKWWA